VVRGALQRARTGALAVVAVAVVKEEQTFCLEQIRKRLHLVYSSFYARMGRRDSEGQSQRRPSQVKI
jgi:hypothetical protein